MSGAPEVRFALSGGAEHGMGHVMRCAAIGVEARARGLRVGFSLHGDESAEAALRDELPDALVTPWSDPGDLALGTGWVVFDTRREISSDIRAVQRSGARALVLDSPAYVEQADLTIHPVLHAAPARHPRVLQGASFCLVPREIRERRPPPYPGARHLLLATLGGADPRGLTERIGAGLERCLQRWPSHQPRPEVHCVLGPAFRDRDRRAAALRARGWRVHGPLSRRALARLMEEALFAVAGFGITVYELAFLGVPMAFLTHRSEDREAAGRLEALGIGRLGGDAERFDPEGFEIALTESLLRPAWREQSSRRGRELVGDGAGARRIVDALAC